jgi:hypothetical protein
MSQRQKAEGLELTNRRPLTSRTSNPTPVRPPDGMTASMGAWCARCAHGGAMAYLVGTHPLHPSGHHSLTGGRVAIAREGVSVKHSILHRNLRRARTQHLAGKQFHSHPDYLARDDQSLAAKHHDHPGHLGRQRGMVRGAHFHGHGHAADWRNAAGHRGRRVLRRRHRPRDRSSEFQRTGKLHPDDPFCWIAFDYRRLLRR